ncbi:MAG: TRAP transporter large permease subunit [Casimicrobiaceae bacterium]|nr:TRAP transporter large permease subunit [Casimicrobiaceae bacterium]MDW8311412.1 TRAP transporter large permease subunit [Burkholderiales bacterium]
MIRRELRFGLGLMGLVVAAASILILRTPEMTSGHYGLLMLGLVVAAILLGFPTAFTLMGMGMIFTFLAYYLGGQGATSAMRQTLDLMVQRAFSVMSNDVLISIPLFVFMGYLVERANLIDRLFRSLHLSLAWLPGSLAVASLFTCAVFATATGIVGAVVTLMGLLALPQMLRAGYDVRVASGAITAGGCLGILIPPSVLLIVYGATAGVSVVQLYAGAFLPGLMLAGLYILYVIVLARVRPQLMPPLSKEERQVRLPPLSERLKQSFSNRVLPALVLALKGRRNEHLPIAALLREAVIALVPAGVFCFAVALIWHFETRIVAADESSTPSELIEIGRDERGASASVSSGLAEPPASSGSEELREPPGSDAGRAATASAVSASVGQLAEPPGAAATAGSASAPVLGNAAGAGASASTDGGQEATTLGRRAPSLAWWIGSAVGLVGLIAFYAVFTFERLEIFRMLLASLFPLLILILGVLGSIVFGLATPTEAAAVGAFGGFLLAAAYRQLNFGVLRESAYLTARTTAMVCWLFVGSAIFSAAFALLGGQELVEQWVMSLNLTPTQFLILSQIIIFLLGWPLEWTEIIVIFMPIFVPLLDNFGIDPLFFGLLVALNLQTAFLSPPVAMSAFYLKGVAPPNVSLNQIFAGMIPFMGIQIVAIVLLYLFPQIGLWLPKLLYG